jgi:transposase
MGFKPALSDARWRRIEKLLPESRRDRQVIEAILYREFSGQSLTEVAEAFEVTRVRLHQ